MPLMKIPSGPENQYHFPEARYFPRIEFDNMLLQAEAIARGFHCSRYAPSLFHAWRVPEWRKLGFLLNGSNLTSRWATAICSNKQVTCLMLQESGIPVPQGKAFRHHELPNAIAFARRLEKAVVLKPLDGGEGRAVKTDIQSESALRAAHALLRKGESFRVEEHVPGNDYRVLVCDDEALSVLMRVPAHVTGDGKSSIASLIERKDRVRRKNPSYMKSLISSNIEFVTEELQKQGLDLQSVPGQGETILLSSTANISRGGEGHEVIEETHKSILHFAIQCYRAIGGLGHCGIDLLLQDHTTPLTDQPYTICEANSHASIGAHLFPSTGKPADVVSDVFTTTLRRTGIEALEKQDVVTTRIIAENSNNPKMLARWATEFSKAIKLELKSLWLEEGKVMMIAQGRPVSLAALSSKLIRPDPRLMAEVIRTRNELL